LIGLVWLAAWFVMSEGREELGPAESITADAAISLRDRRIWAYIAMYALGNVPLGFVLYTTSLYLTKVFALKQTELAAYLWIPPLGWELGYFFWGWTLDRMLPNAPNPRRVFERLFVIAWLLMTPFIFAWMAGSAVLLIGLYFVTMFATGAFIIPAIGYATHVFGSRQSGYIAGLGAGSFSAVHAILMPWIGRMFDQQAYVPAFAIVTLAPAVGLLLWWKLSQPRPAD
jgi:ACS family hexuronate transporter-like MFS transporter